MVGKLCQLLPLSPLCVYLRERERERERKKKKEREGERGETRYMYMYVYSYMHVCIMCIREKREKRERETEEVGQRERVRVTGSKRVNYFVRFNFFDRDQPSIPSTGRSWWLVSVSCTFCLLLSPVTSASLTAPPNTSLLTDRRADSPW